MNTQRRALAIYEATFGRDRRKTATQLSNLAEVRLFLGHDAEAFSLLSRARAAYEKTLPADHPFFIGNHLSAGLIHLRAGRLKDALRELERARAVLAASGGNDVAYRPQVELALARALYLAGSRARARQTARRLRGESPAEAVASAEQYLTDLGLAGPPVTDLH